MSLVAVEQAYKDDKKSITQALQNIFTPFGGINNFLFPDAVVLINLHSATAVFLAESLKEALAEKGIENITLSTNLTNNTFTKVKVPEPLVVEEIEVYEKAAKADVIFNVASMAGLNRNAFALSIYNLTALLSNAAKDKFTATHSARALVDLYQTLTPQFNIVDNLIVEANTCNEPSFIIASTDAVALDSLSALYAGADSRDAEYLVLAHQYGFGVGNLNEITLTGNYEGIFAWE
ncbi:MAG: DUF362 domain-containing protein [Clostridia bacterium]|nr:DUF362 domain-containing protein [Clostridia bacterium]